MFWDLIHAEWTPTDAGNASYIAREAHDTVNNPNFEMAYVTITSNSANTLSNPFNPEYFLGI